MSEKRNQPTDWQLGVHESYMPVYYKGAVAGFFKKEYSETIIRHLNEDELLKKALTKACTDLIRQSGGDTSQVKELIKKYLINSERPKFGTFAIASFLRERQQELDLGDKEFTKFCDTFKVSPVELNNIYAGDKIEDGLLAPLARILGISKDELLKVRDGQEDSSIS
jgi:hypothetical protein